MRSLFILSVMMLSLRSCASIHSTVDKKCIAYPTEEYIVKEPRVRDFKTELRLYGFSPHQRGKALTAAEILRLVVTSKRFKNEVLNYSYEGRKGFLGTELSNEEVYRKIVTGNEWLLTLGDDYTMTMDLSPYTPKESDRDGDGLETVAYTYEYRNMVWYNTKFFNSSNPAEISGTLMHEWLHKLGFTHSREHTPIRRHSVPYAVGYIVGRLAVGYYRCPVAPIFPLLPSFLI